jgi:hypothetical protein
LEELNRQNRASPDAEQLQWKCLGIKVNSGIGSTGVTTPKAPGSAVAIAANAAPSGQEFIGWEGETAALGVRPISRTGRRSLRISPVPVRRPRRSIPFPPAEASVFYRVNAQ